MIALDAVIPLSQIPKKMQRGGEAEKKLAEGSPENIDILPRFEGFEPGPKQFSLRDEETVIPSEPRSITDVNPMNGGNTFPSPVLIPDRPMSSEPSADYNPYRLEERLFMTPTIRPQEVYPRDPDPGIMAPFPPPPPPSRFFNNTGAGGIPNLLQANMLKPLGILSINKTYNL